MDDEPQFSIKDFRPSALQQLSSIIQLNMEHKIEQRKESSQAKKKEIMPKVKIVKKKKDEENKKRFQSV